MQEIRVALVEKHVMVRDALVSHLELEDDIVVVAELDDGAELMGYLANQSGPVPHVVVVAVWLLEKSGIVLAQRLQQQGRHIRVIGLLDVHDPKTVHQMISAGAYGCVSKSRKLVDLIEMIRNARYKGDHLDGESKRIADAYEKERAAFPTLSGLPVDHEQENPNLTLREFDVLKCLCQAYSNHQIGKHLGISTRTVQAHLTHIYNKMKVTGRTEAVVKAFHNRWVFPILAES